MAEPIVQIILRDEFTSQIATMKEKLKQVNQEVRTGRASAEFKAFTNTVQRAAYEVGSALRATGLGTIVAGGFVSTLGLINRQLVEFSRERINMHYTAQELNTTIESMEHLVHVGMALGQTREQSMQGVRSLVSGLRNLQVYGPLSKEWQQLATAARGSGIILAQDLIQAMREGGVDRASALLFDRMRGMTPEARRFIVDTFNLGSTAWMDALQVGPLRQRIHVSIEQMRSYFATWTNLGISLDNIKDRIGMAVMPAFERLVSRLDDFLASSGVGEKLEKYFDRIANYLETQVNWEQVGKELANIFRQLRAFWIWLKWAFEQLDPYVQKIGGWGTVITAALSLSFVGWITGVGAGFAAIAKWGMLLPLIAGAAQLVGAAAKPKEGEGGEGGSAGKKTENTAPTDPWSQGVRVAEGGTQQVDEVQRQRQQQQINDMIKQAQSQPIPGMPYQRGTMRRPGSRGQAPRATQPQFFAQQTRQRETDLINLVRGTTEEFRKLNESLSLGELKGGALAFTGGTSSSTSGPSSSGGSDDGSPQGPSRTGDKETPAHFANVRFNNPGAQAWGVGSREFGGKPARTGTGHSITSYPTPVHGAASNMFLLSRRYVGMTIASAMRLWSGGSRSIPGPGGKPYPPNMVITREMANDPNFVIPFLKAITSGEGKGRYPMDQAQWEQAFRWYQNAGVPIDPKTNAPEQALKREVKDPAFNPQDPPPQPPATGPDQPAPAPGQGPTTYKGMDLRAGEMRLVEPPGTTHGYTRGGVRTQDWLIDTVRQATRALPPGYRAEVISTVDPRSTGTPWHPSGRAIDIQIYDDKGNKVPYIGNRNVPGYGIYERVALAARQYAERVYPKQNFIWGGHFHSGTPYDRMHFQSGGVSAENFTAEQLRSPVLPNYGVKPGSINQPAPVDPSIHKILWTNMPDNGDIVVPPPRPNIPVTIRVRSRRGAAQVKAQSGGDVKVGVEHSLGSADPTGGGKIESPA